MRSSSALRLLTALAALIVFSVKAGGEEAETVDRVIDGVLARCGAIKTATFQYRYATLWGDPTKAESWDEDPRSRNPVFLTVDGEQWALRWLGAPNTEMHRKVYDATYVPTPQQNGTVLHSLRLTKPEATLDKEALEDQKYQIVRAGTIPWPRMQDYLRSHRLNVRDHGTVAVEGEKTRLLEWVVPREDYAVLSSYNPVLSDQGTATLLRIYVIPKMGYVVRRLDYCTPEGEMANRYESSDFREVAKGIYFPWNHYYVRNFRDFGNRKGYYSDLLRVIALTGVNKPLPKSAFDIALPAGTEVSDYRESNEGVFVTTRKATLLSQIDEAIGKKTSAQGTDK
jgi:hypothetical protein